MPDSPDQVEKEVLEFPGGRHVPKEVEKRLQEQPRSRRGTTRAARKRRPWSCMPRGPGPGEFIHTTYLGGDGMARDHHVRKRVKTIFAEHFCQHLLFGRSSDKGGRLPQELVRRMMRRTKR